MKSATVAAFVAVAAGQFVDPYDRFVRERLVRSGVSGEIPIRQGNGSSLPMKAAAGDTVLDQTILNQGGLYPQWGSLVRGVPTATYGYPQIGSYLPEQAYLAATPVRTAGDAAYWAGLDNAQKRAKLDIVNQDNNIDQYGTQAGAVEALNRARSNAGSLTTRDSLTPTAITSERTYVGPKSATDQGFKQAGSGAFRNTANAVNRSNKAGTSTLEPIYIA